MNTWHFQDGDIILSSDDQDQLELANQWIVSLREAIRLQTMEEVNGRSELSSDSKYEQPELSEVPC